MKARNDKIAEMLDQHKLWLADRQTGKRLVIHNDNLRGADLSDTDLQYADLRHSDLSGSNLGGADLRYANLCYANLLYTNLCYANLSSANLDFSCWPLFCGSMGVNVDAKIAIQLIAHVVSLICDDEEIKEAQKVLLPLARKCHRARELGLVEEEI